MRELPVVFHYQRALDDFRRQRSGDSPLLKRMSELISLLDFTTTLNSRLSGKEILDAALLIVMGELQAGRGCLFVRDEGGSYRLRASRGLTPGAPGEAPLAAVGGETLLFRESGRHREVFEAFGLEVLCPIEKAGRTIAVLGLGPRMGGRSYDEEAGAFLRGIASCAATPVENGLIYDELSRVNRSLSVKVFQLGSLFDISRELTASLDEETIKGLVTTTLMGHLMVSRCALYLRGPDGLVLAHGRGLREDEADALLPESELGTPGVPRGPVAVADLPEGPLRDRFARARMALLVPLSLGERLEGLLAAGERASGAPFGEEDRDFAHTLARQALAALESVRLHRVRVEKERQDRDLQIAREIQRSLFPKAHPRIPGCEVAAVSRPCQEVGGDYYDFIPLSGGRLALAIADVSGKGTPASILMASVHASLQALAGSTPLHTLMERLNRFLFESTQANKYVTLFYAELDTAGRRLRYANAGHVPPYVIQRVGEAFRLIEGGPALGMLEGVAFEVGELALGGGDVVAMVTDGVTEALSPQEQEFGDERMVDSLRRTRDLSAAEAVKGLVESVESWTGAAGCSDDLTALVLKAL